VECHPSGKKGIYITRWELSDEQPTIEQLEKWAKKNPDKLIPKPSKKETVLTSLKALKGKGKNFDPDALIDAVVMAIED